MKNIQIPRIWDEHNQRYILNYKGFNFWRTNNIHRLYDEVLKRKLTIIGANRLDGDVIVSVISEGGRL